MTNQSVFYRRGRNVVRGRQRLASATCALSWLFLATGCGFVGGSSESATNTESDSAVTENNDAAEQVTTSDTTATAGDDGALAFTCPETAASTVGTVATSGLTEASGLAASIDRPGVLWAHNDSGSATAVYAIGPNGEDLGRIAVPAIDGVDIEDMALSDGMLYLADIGDNNGVRGGVTVYRFPEPDPATVTEVTAVEATQLRYPDGATDAEAMFVDPATGQLVIVAKAITFRLSADAPVGPGPAPIFVADPAWGGDPVTMTEVGTVALDDLAEQAEGEIPEGPIADFGLAGLATGADIRADGGAIVLRTYRTAWLFPRLQDQSVAEALAGTPCQTRTVPEGQGEAIAFLQAGDNSFATISEGLQPALNITTAGPG